jgi:hypothetical protein
VDVDNQFGLQEGLIVYGPVALAVPTEKQFPGPHGPPVGLDHFLLYEVLFGDPVGVPVGLVDEFDYEPGVFVDTPHYFANPVQKVYGEEVSEVVNPGAHLMFYDILGGLYFPQVLGLNQFRFEDLSDLVSGPGLLAVPSLKLSCELVEE